MIPVFSTQWNLPFVNIIPRCFSVSVSDRYRPILNLRYRYRYRRWKKRIGAFLLCTKVFSSQMWAKPTAKAWLKLAHQQDNDPKYSSKKKRIKVLQWSSRSPDLSEASLERRSGPKFLRNHVRDWWHHTQNDYFMLLLLKVVQRAPESWLITRCSFILSLFISLEVVLPAFQDLKLTRCLF